MSFLIHKVGSNEIKVYICPLHKEQLIYVTPSLGLRPCPVCFKDTITRQKCNVLYGRFFGKNIETIAVRFKNEYGTETYYIYLDSKVYIGDCPGLNNFPVSIIMKMFLSGILEAKVNDALRISSIL